MPSKLLNGTALIFCLILVSAQTAQAQRVPTDVTLHAELVPNDVALDIYRNKISPKTVTFNNSALVLHEEDLASIRVAPAADTLTSILKDLNALADWPKFAAYQSYLLSLPGRTEMIPVAKHDLDLNNDSVKEIKIWNLDRPERSTIWAHHEKKIISDNNAFARHGNEPGYDADNAIFFRLSGFEADVPEVVFWTAQSAFVNGLVTRLILAKFDAEMQKTSSQYSLEPLPKVVFRYKKELFETKDTWEANKPIDFVINKVLSKNPIQGDALLYGWAAGDELAKAETRFQTAVWSLLKRNYNMRRIGQMVGYTLSYLEGYSQNLSYGRPAGSNTATDAEILAKLSEISATAGTDMALRATVREREGVPPAAWLNQTLFVAITAEQYNTALQSPPNRRLLASFRQFLQGFNQGSIRAANAVYADTFLLAYGLGYSDGFADGYAKGYAEGYRAGYNQGAADARRSFWNSVGNFIGGAGALGVVGAVLSIL